ncbi:hypothetical protein QMA10_14730 [Arthrobacter sp. APC 3897]|jgi:hypothetical protein|uniref:hypothetical protein n=1 Tax=Arthrobacter sp. APC 3897 TaxID=3035204 RepID=UPI0025B5C878|nr:hypothetical protein [Arthrobacter sp. APC 3897]MDN3483170.1 hypothetical protein [Arthrobacter sp. APC 3897]
MGLMEIELARTLHRERLAKAGRLRQRNEHRRMARERQAVETADQRTGPMADWPIFSLRIGGGFQLTVFRTLRLGA